MLDNRGVGNYASPMHPMGCEAPGHARSNELHLQAHWGLRAQWQQRHPCGPNTLNNYVPVKLNHSPGLRGQNKNL